MRHLITVITVLALSTSAAFACECKSETDLRQNMIKNAKHNLALCLKQSTSKKDKADCKSMYKFDKSGGELTTF